MIFDRVSRLKRSYSKLEMRYRQELRRAKSPVDQQRIESEMRLDLESIEEVISVERTRKLEREARNLDIPIPSESQAWGQTQIEGDGYLYACVRDDLQKRIRKEKQERRDQYFGILKDIVLLASGLLAIAHTIWWFTKK